MSATIDTDRKAPTIDSKPPSLPPYLTPKRRGNGKYQIVPSVAHARIKSKTLSEDRKIWTLHMTWMVRIELASGVVEGPVHVNSRQYRNWLETYEYDRDIPPHILFGGPRDPNATLPDDHYEQWVTYAQRMFC